MDCFNVAVHVSCLYLAKNGTGEGDSGGRNYLSLHLIGQLGLARSLHLGAQTLRPAADFFLPLELLWKCLNITLSAASITFMWARGSYIRVSPGNF